MQRHGGEDVKTDHKVGVMLPRANEASSQQKWEDKREDAPLELWKGVWSCRDLDSGFLPQNYERLHFQCFKPSSVCPFITAVLGKKYTQESRRYPQSVPVGSTPECGSSYFSVTQQFCEQSYLPGHHVGKAPQTDHPQKNVSWLHSIPVTGPMNCGFFT